MDEQNLEFLLKEGPGSFQEAVRQATFRNYGCVSAAYVRIGFTPEGLLVACDDEENPLMHGSYRLIHLPDAGLTPIVKLTVGEEVAFEARARLCDAAQRYNAVRWGIYDPVASAEEIHPAILPQEEIQTLVLDREKI